MRTHDERVNQFKMIANELALIAGLQIDTGRIEIQFGTFDSVEFHFVQPQGETDDGKIRILEDANIKLRAAVESMTQAIGYRGSLSTNAGTWQTVGPNMKVSFTVRDNDLSTDEKMEETIGFLRSYREKAADPNSMMTQHRTTTPPGAPATER